MLQSLRTSFIITLVCLLLCFICALPLAQAQTPRYDLAKAIGISNSAGDNRSEARRTVVDAAGNMYVVGEFAGRIQFGQFTLTSAGAPHDVFVAKLDSMGNYLWVAQGGGSAEDYGNAIGLDATGNVYIAGSVGTGFANAQFGSIAVPGTPGTVTDDVVVAKLSPAGTWLWAVSGGGNFSERVGALAVDGGGNIYVTGSTHSAKPTFGTITLTNPYEQYVAYTLKLNSAGNWLWAVLGGGIAGGSTESYDIVLDDGGNAYITGYFMGPTVNFGPLQVRSGTSYPAVFVAKLSSGGQYQWVVPGGGGLYDYGYGIALDSQRNIYITGSFDSPTAPFGPFTLTNINSPLNQQNPDIFVAKLTPTGQYQWAVSAGGRYRDQGTSIRVDAQDRVLLTGTYNSTNIRLGNVTLTNQNVGSPDNFGFYDTYLTQLNPVTGQFLWGIRGGGNASDFSTDLAVGGPGNAPHMTGYTGYTVYSTPAAASFGPFTLPFNPSGYTGFVARLSAPAPTVQLVGDSLLCAGGQVTLRAITSTAVQAYRWNTGATTPTLTVNQPGSYSLTVTFSSGQSATASFEVRALPTSLAISGDTVLCPGTTGQLRASASPGATYQWSTGAQTATIAVTQPGTYSLTASYGSGCRLTTSIRVRLAALQISGSAQLCPDQGSTAQLLAVAAGATAYRWNTGATTAQLTVSQAGTYTVTASFANGCTLTATQVVNIPQARIQGDSLLCPGRTTQLSAATSAATSYRWSTGATTAAIAISQPGTYSVSVSFGPGCSAMARYHVRAEVANPAFTLGADTTVCEGEHLVLSARVATASNEVQYQWSDGSTGPTLVVQQPGVYRLQRITRCETQTATRQITFQSCLFIPNIITPNNDGLNDLFVVKGLPPGAWSLEVFNRWGRQVYQTAAYQADWGSQAAPGPYYYLLRQAATGRSYKGWVEVVR
jgi:gliding motility-associated-like protein